MTRGRSILGPRRALMGVLAASGLIASLFAAPTTLGAASLDLDPTTGLPGDPIKATAREFPPGDVEFFWDGTLSLGVRTANTQGHAVLPFNIPAGAAPGQHTVLACSPGCVTSAPGTVTVSAAPTPTPAPTPVPTPPPTPAPTPRPTPRATPTPRPATPHPSIPGATTSPASPTPAESGSPSPSSTGSDVPTPFPTPPPVETASPPAPSEPAGGSGSPSATPQATVLPAGPASEGSGSLVGVVVPVGAIGALLLVAFLFARGRWRPLLARSGGPRPGRPRVPRAARWRRRRDEEPDALSALHDPLAPFLEPIVTSGASAASGPSSEPPAATPPAASAAPAAPAASATPAPAEPWSSARTISFRVEHIEADDA